MNPNLELFCGKRRIDGATLQQQANRAAAGFQSLRLQRGDAVAVVRAAGSALTEEQVRGWLRERLVGYKVPRLVEFHDALPREGTGKVFKNQLRAPHWERAGRRI